MAPTKVLRIENVMVVDKPNVAVPVDACYVNRARRIDAHERTAIMSQDHRFRRLTTREEPTPDPLPTKF
jgi:hypothetical protein